MPPLLALLIGCGFVFYAFRSERLREIGDTKYLFWPTLWYLVVSTHPVGYWLQLWGVSLPGDGGDPTEGSVVDRYFFSALTFIGLSILVRRRHFRWTVALRQNPWLVALLVYMALSIAWSDYPFISFKRYIKVIGSIAMAWLILTNSDPLAALATVLRRCLYIHLPMSIICIKYFRDIGVSYEWGGRTETWEGISTSKNVLGQVTVLAVLYFSWQVWHYWRKFGVRNIDVLYLLMALHLLKGAKSISMTSVSVCLFALTIFFRTAALRFRPAAARAFVYSIFGGTISIVAFVIAHSVFLFSADSFFGRIITFLGRDITMTDRTYIWTDIYAVAAKSPLLGIGFGSFWIGRMANIPWTATKSWVLAQAHSGYVDTYLQLGLVGMFLLFGTLFSVIPRLSNSLKGDFHFASLRITLLIVIAFINMTESVYLRGDHHLWFILMVVLWQIPRYSGATRVHSAAPKKPEPKNEPIDGVPAFAHLRGSAS